MNESAASNVSYRTGILAHEIEDAIELYELAFGEKLGRAIARPADRIALMRAGWRPEFAIAASCDNRLVGLAGFQTVAGSLTGGMTGRSILRRLGFWRGIRACAILSCYDREPAPRELVMDGIVVHPDYRGHGIGTNLLARIVAFACDQGLETVRLDVIDTNRAARRLYERCGFRVLREEQYPYLARVLGFSGSATMTYDVSQCPLA